MTPITNLQLSSRNARSWHGICDRQTDRQTDNPRLLKQKIFRPVNFAGVTAVIFFVTDKPVSMPDKSLSGTPVPLSNVAKPCSSPEKLLSMLDKPFSNAEKSLFATNKPLSNTTKPFSVTEKPLSKTDKGLSGMHKVLNLRYLDDLGAKTAPFHCPKRLTQLPERFL